MPLDIKALENNEIANDYARKPSKEGRWSLTWGVFKSNFGKLVLINLMILLFFVPGVGIMIFRSMYIAGMGLQYPFNANAGVGYPAYPGTQGLTESIYFSADVLFYALLIVAGLIASVGISGGAYCIKRLLNTQGEFKFKTFFTKGVKNCYFNTALPVTIFMLFFVMTVLVGDWKDSVAATGGATAGPITAYVFAIIATVLVGMYCAWLLAVGVSYKLKLWQLLKNSFVLLIATPLQSIFFAGLALVPVWIFLLGKAAQFFTIVSYIVFIFIGLMYILLVWISFTQGIFDLFVTPNIKKVEEEKNAKKTPEELAREKEEKERELARELVAVGKSELIGRPILPISSDPVIKLYGKTYTREDLTAAASGRKKLSEDIEAYYEEHKNDKVYAEYNKLFAEREKALQSDSGKKGKKKKVSSDNLLR